MTINFKGKETDGQGTGTTTYASKPKYSERYKNVFFRCSIQAIFWTKKRSIKLLL